jgi:hypothetical protein
MENFMKKIFYSFSLFVAIASLASTAYSQSAPYWIGSNGECFCYFPNSVSLATCQQAANVIINETGGGSGYDCNTSAQPAWTNTNAGCYWTCQQYTGV